MPLVCDTNVLPFRGYGRNLAFEAALLIARARGLAVLVPELALEEATALRRREIEAAFQQAASALASCRTYADVPQPTLPDPATLAHAWRKALQDRVELIPTPDGAADEALRREIERLPPAREGKGARDVVIWLSTLAALTGTADLLYFVSQNSRDFAAADDTKTLHAALRSELGPLEARFCYFSSLDDFLGVLAQSGTASLDGARLCASQEVLASLSRAIEEGLDIREIAPLLPPGHEYLSGPPQALACDVLAQRSFSVDAFTYVVADTRWQLALPIGVVGFSTGGGASLAHHSFTGTLRTHLWLKIAAGETLIAEADVSSIRAERPGASGAA